MYTVAEVLRIVLYAVLIVLSAYLAMSFLAMGRKVLGMAFLATALLHMVLMAALAAYLHGLWTAPIRFLATPILLLQIIAYGMLAVRERKFTSVRGA